MLSALVPPTWAFVLSAVGPGQPAADFGWHAQAPLGDGRGVLHLLGMESPGLTSALALGERVAAHWQEAFA